MSNHVTICADRALQLHGEVAALRRQLLASQSEWRWCGAADVPPDGAVLLVRGPGAWARFVRSHAVICVTTGDSQPPDSVTKGVIFVDRAALSLDVIVAAAEERAGRASRTGVSSSVESLNALPTDAQMTPPETTGEADGSSGPGVDLTDVLDTFARSSFTDIGLQTVDGERSSAAPGPSHSQGAGHRREHRPEYAVVDLPARDEVFTPWTQQSLVSEPVGAERRHVRRPKRQTIVGPQVALSDGDGVAQSALSRQSELAQRILGVVGEAMGTLGADPVRNVKRLLHMALNALSAVQVRFEHVEGWSLVADHHVEMDGVIDWDAVSSLVLFEDDRSASADMSGSAVSGRVVNAGVDFGELNVRLSPGEEETDFVRFVVVLTSTSVALELARQRVEHASELRYRMVDTLLEASTAAVGLVSAIGTPDRVNSAWTALAEEMGWTVATLARRAGPGLVGWDRVVAGVSDTNELVWTNFRLEVARRPIAQPDGRTGVVITLTDLTDMAAEHQRLRHEARRDSLTALPNRRSLNDWLDARTNERAIVELCILDLDDFKSVNERWGHNAGDLVLRIAGQRLSRFLHQGCIVARLGGDEFVVARVAREATSGQLGDQILDALKDPIPVNGGQRSIGASVGSATGYASGVLMRRADGALFEAKRRGKRCHVFRRWSSTEEAASLVTRAELEMALSNSDIGVAVQPIYDTDGNEVVSVELLARWTHAEHGFIPPDVFVELAENSGLICQLTDYMISRVPHVLRMVERRWGGTNIRAAVNVSFEDIASGRLVDAVRRMTGAGVFDAHRLIIEITERSAVEDVDRARDAFHQLRLLGCSVALDDFGSGYSSLGVLRRLGVDIVKVDRSFLSHGDNDDADMEQFFRSVVHFCASLGFEVIAEGVETEDDLLLVRQAGAGRAQGYFLGRPEMLNLPRITDGLRLPTQPGAHGG